jgi:hypothetical protein
MSHRLKTVLTRTSLTASSSARLIVAVLRTGFSVFTVISSIAANYQKNFLEHRYVFARGDYEDTALRMS